MFLHLENMNTIVLAILVSLICLITLVLLITVFYLLVKRSSRRRVLSLTMHRKERGFVDGDRAPPSVCFNASENSKDLSIDKPPSTDAALNDDGVRRKSPPRILVTTPSLRDKEIPLSDIPLA